VSEYTKISRYNPRLSFEQYKIVLKRKKLAREENERVRYKDLVKEWGIRHHRLERCHHLGREGNVRTNVKENKAAHCSSRSFNMASATR